MRVVTSAPNKIILCGEHFVVYGAPALAIPTDNRNRVVLISSEGDPAIHLKSELGEAVYSQDGSLNGSEAFNIFLPAIRYALQDAKLDEAVNIEIFSRVSKGMGSSSSLGASVGLALLTYMNKRAAESDMFECGQLVDEIAHGGKSSGIDAKTVIRGKPQRFRKSFRPTRFDFEDIGIELPEGSSLIVVDTFKGEREQTGQLIEKFAEAYGIKKTPEELTDEERRNLFRDYDVIFGEFINNCRKDGNAEWLGNAFNENHKLLSAVSTREIEEARAIALRNGAYGAKLTGSGGKGGAVIALAPNDKEDGIIRNLESAGYTAFSVETAKEGAKVELAL